MESAVAEERGKVEGFAADYCNATLVVEEALLKLKHSELKHFLYILLLGFTVTQKYSVESNQMASVTNNATIHCTIQWVRYRILRSGPPVPGCYNGKYVCGVGHQSEDCGLNLSRHPQFGFLLTQSRANAKYIWCKAQYISIYSLSAQEDCCRVPWFD